MTTTPNEPDPDQPADVEAGDVAENPANPDEDPGIDPPADTGDLVPDPTRIAETEAAEEPAGE